MTKIRDDLLLAQSAVRSRINSPADKVDIVKWLLSIPDAEYRRCAPGDHLRMVTDWNSPTR
ncbi:hypothetical protein ACFRCX_13875 [Streptomyces sp. NPDC056652]|uniref:hypothetical protein n=1 Tax=Streptomyces sp. NPDC056652 TaxID=3345893 RepID=UPI0036BE583F